MKSMLYWLPCIFFVIVASERDPLTQRQSRQTHLNSLHHKVSVLNSNIQDFKAEAKRLRKEQEKFNSGELCFEELYKLLCCPFMSCGSCFKNPDLDVQTKK